MTHHKNITFSSELNVKNAEKLRAKLISSGNEKASCSLELRNINDMDFAGAQLVLAALKSGHLSKVTFHQLHPDIRDLLIKTGFDSLIK